uniref:receptor protein-tyrosine kinase n=1 Tax=Cynoglossus semilaevis TaxID=244447 RepID=A0A3P8V7S1_CYNSE
MVRIIHICPYLVILFLTCFCLPFSPSHLSFVALLSQVPVLSSILVLVLVAIFFLIILITLWRKKPHYEVRWKVIESVSVDCHHYTYIDPGCLPYDSAWEIPRDSIVLGKVLGLGAFGRVVEANISGLTGPDSTTKVAVKMVKQNNSSVQSLMSELKVLVHLGPHLNVVNLLGACTTPTGPVYVITEFCHHGDLLNYLHKNKHTFLQTDAQTESDGGYMDMSEEKNTQYVAMKTINSTQIEPTVYETPYPSLDETFLLLDDSSALSHNDLLSFSYQIAQAMDFLSSKNCVHRDLAARNALVCEGKLVKICDFGLARDLTKDQNYIARGNNFLPLKWMAPESVFKSVYSSQSDVWSYGILLWEIFSLGESPYPDIPRTRDFYSALRRGYRMTCPDHTPQTVYNLMTECWMEKPEARPSFTSVVSTFRNMMSDDYNKRYVRMTEEFLKGQNPAAIRFRAGQTHESPISEDKVRLLEVGPEEAGPSCSS